MMRRALGSLCMIAGISFVVLGCLSHVDYRSPTACACYGLFLLILSCCFNLDDINAALRAKGIRRDP